MQETTFWSTYVQGSYMGKKLVEEFEPRQIDFVQEAHDGENDSNKNE